MFITSAAWVPPGALLSLCCISDATNKDKLIKK